MSRLRAWAGAVAHSYKMWGVRRRVQARADAGMVVGERGFTTIDAVGLAGSIVPRCRNILEAELNPPYRQSSRHRDD